MFQMVSMYTSYIEMHGIKVSLAHLKYKKAYQGLNIIFQPQNITFLILSPIFFVQSLPNFYAKYYTTVDTHTSSQIPALSVWGGGGGTNPSFSFCVLM